MKIIIIFAILIAVLTSRFFKAEVWAVIFFMLGFGAIGFVDDFIKVILKRNFWMVDKSEYVISYVYREFGGAYKTLKYAQKTGKNIISADTYE